MTMMILKYLYAHKVKISQISNIKWKWLLANIPLDKNRRKKAWIGVPRLLWLLKYSGTDAWYYGDLLYIILLFTKPSLQNSVDIP